MSGLQGFLDQGQGADVDVEVGEQEGRGHQPEPQEHEGPEVEQKAEGTRPPELKPEPKPEAEPDPQGQQQQPEREDARRVPLAALEAERRARQKHQDEAAELRRQLEEFRKAPPQPAPQPAQQHQPPQRQAPQLPDPNENPVGYITALMEHQRREAQEAIVMERFNTSEALLRQRIGDEQLDAVVAEFKAAAEADPLLQMQLNQQRDPFGFAHQTVQRLRTLREVGDDPAAYRARVEAEIRQKLQEEAAAQMGGRPPQQQQRPPLRTQPSIAAARSVAGRDTLDDSDMPLADILRR